ncbi:microcin ABC transporter ATP-binding protein [Pseudomonas chlororaphis]|jgi:peptide/nickel transport system ATP-binding protein|uniref:ABC-type dipeptide transporter n=1 Tax=Pseudomonas morbosilactucae TaxID=2938197 RepID=A0ABT0JFB9_9PSED|nr:ABC transporter ATP-binding protein [Pseudomonas morbosilactucae]MCK9814621.1 ABC transporter ATP-binding protein [Pseudomonas morbosilactucae]ROL69150.1 microcin ABC transporter ATP-binding protein [Pseudomonas chlororaphis]
MHTSSQVLRVDNLSIELPAGADRSHAVQGISLEVRKGEILCVIGESGSGKSVLSAAIMGDYAKGLRHSAGHIDFLGQDICAMDDEALRQLRGNRIAMIFQEPMAALNPAIRIGRQVEEIFAIHAPKMPADERRERMLALLESTQLPDPPRIANSFPHQLSGGQCQRVVIAMALAMNPDLLIADEPTTALDVTTQAQVLKLVRDLRGRGQHGILFITHDFGVVAEIADRIAVMEGGRLVEIGERDQVLNAPRHAYTRKLIAAVPALYPELHAPCADGELALRIERLNKVYDVGGRKVQALRDVSLQLPRGKTLAIVGESGSGKSTLVKAAIRLVDSDSGHVWVGDTDFLALSGAALAANRRRIQMIFQDPYGSLNPRHRVGDIIARAARLRGLSAKDAWAEAGDLLEQVGLKRDALNRKPRQFSGGQRQRIGIARALAMRPEVLIADESVSALDVSVQKQVLELLAELQQRLNLSILFITHDLRVAAQISDSIAVMRQGEVVEYGSAEQVLLRPQNPYTQTLLAAAPGAKAIPTSPHEPPLRLIQPSRH